MKMLRRKMIAAVLGLLSAACLSAGAEASTWKARASESRLEIKAIQQGAEFTGRFETFAAEIVFNPADLAAAKVVATIKTGSFNSSSKDRDGQVREKDWFHVAQFPDATFKTKSFAKTGESRYEAIADLTIRDVTREVVLPFTLVIDGDVARMAGEVTLKRTDYGVGQGDWASGAWVGLDVKVLVTIVADRAP